MEDNAGVNCEEIQALWGRWWGAEQVLNTRQEVETLPFITSCSLPPSLFNVPSSLQASQRRRSLGLLRLRERRPPPMPGEGRLGRWLLSFLLSPSLSRTRSRSLSPSAALLAAATPLVAVLPSFSRPFGFSIFFSSSHFLYASSCSLRRRSRSFCRSKRSKSLRDAWKMHTKIIQVRYGVWNKSLQLTWKLHLRPTCSSVRGSQYIQGAALVFRNRSSSNLAGGSSFSATKKTNAAEHNKEEKTINNKVLKWSLLTLKLRKDSRCESVFIS